MTVPYQPAFCKHFRNWDACGDCAYVRAQERYPWWKPANIGAEEPTPELADEDLFVDRGDDLFTFVAKGDEIPRDLVDLPRVPRGKGKQKK